MNITPGETRIARLENGIISELFIEREGEQQITGNIYKGVVTRVLPGMQAAFVDIGLEKAAFLYVTDIIPDLFEDDEDEEEENNATPDRPAEGDIVEGTAPAEAGSPNAETTASPNQSISQQQKNQKNNRRGRGRRREAPPKIETIIKEGQQIVVQVAKEPIRTKGARVTCHISLPGRHVVMMPTVNHVGVSRRIGSYEERQRLRAIINNQRGKYGFIGRTMSIGGSQEAIEADINNLKAIWSGIAEKQESAKTPSLIYQDMNIVLRSVRDLMNPDLDQLVIDSEEDHRQIMDFMNKFMPDLANRVQLYNGDVPLFDVYGIETEINRALGKKVWLKSGGYIIIDSSEALAAIDVNTGRFVGKHDFEETILQTNLEAAQEVAYQLKLRNIGGIIIIDFIDMEKYSNRQKVYYALKDALRKDKVRTTISKISELGLVEMTRKRTRDSLTQMISESCYACGGKGHTKTPLTVTFELFRELKRTAPHINAKQLVLYVNPRVAQVIFNEARSHLESLEKRFSKRISVEVMDSMHVEKFDIGMKA